MTSLDSSSPEARQESEEQVDALVRQFEDHEQEQPPPPPHNVELKKYERGANWLMQVVWVTHRSMLNNSRNTQFFCIRVGETVFTAVLLGLLFFQLSDDQTSINDRAGLLVCLALSVVRWRFSRLTSVAVLQPIERFLQ